VVLIVDDDRSVHQTTLLALRDAKIERRPLQFLHAYSAAEARETLMSNEDIAVVLLDVVMETDTAGLQLVPAIRGSWAGATQDHRPHGPAGVCVRELRHRELRRRRLSHQGQADALDAARARSGAYWARAVARTPGSS